MGPPIVESIGQSTPGRRHRTRRCCGRCCTVVDTTHLLQTLSGVTFLLAPEEEDGEEAADEVVEDAIASRLALALALDCTALHCTASEPCCCCRCLWYVVGVGMAFS